MPLDPQAKLLLDAIGISSAPGIETLTPHAARERSRMFAEIRRQMGVEEVDQVWGKRIPGPAGKIPIRIYSPDISKPAPALVYFHGGGWVIGDLDTVDGICRSLANKAGCIIVSVDYRLAPEAKFPAAVEDCYAATQWVASNASELGIDRDRIAVGGDSAGGNLSAVVSQIARDRGGPKLAYQLLIYPGTDMRMGWPSVEENKDAPILSKAGLIWFTEHYVRTEQDKLNPLASPLLAEDLADLPPACVLTAEMDPIRDEGEAYASRLQEFGVEVELKRYDGMPHGFFSFGAALDGAREAHNDSAVRLQEEFRMGTVRAGE